MPVNLWNDKRLRLTLTRLGMQYLGALMLMGFFAVNSGNNLLYLVFSMMLGLFLVSGWVSRRAIQGFRLQSIDEGNIFARVKGGIRVRFQDRHPRRVRGLEIHLEVDRTHVEPGFHGGGKIAEDIALVVLQVRPETRGWCKVRHLELRTRFPFGFLEKAWRFPAEKDLLVLPHPRATPPSRRTEGTSSRFKPKPGVSSPEGARPFRVGDSLSRVHWKRTAQRGTPWIRTFEGEEPLGLRLRLDVRQWAPGVDFEKELELLSGAILQARLQKRDVSLGIQAFEGFQGYSGPTECWRALALVRAQGTSTQSTDDSAAFPVHGLAIL